LSLDDGILGKRESPVLSVRRDFWPEPSYNRLITAEQAATLKRLAEAAYELDAFKPNLKRSEADLRIAALIVAGAEAAAIAARHG
jgi:hypothetical protein